MKKLVYMVLMCVAGSVMMACGTSQAEQEKRRADSIEQAEQKRVNDSIEMAKRAQERREQEINDIKAFIKTIYCDKVDISNESWIDAHVTAKCKIKLENDYPYEGHGYATWEIGGWDDDGLVGKFDHIDVVNADEGIYNVVFLPEADQIEYYHAQGQRTIQLQIHVENGVPKINRYERITDYKFNY